MPCTTVKLLPFLLVVPAYMLVTLMPVLAPRRSLRFRPAAPYRRRDARVCA